MNPTKTKLQFAHGGALRLILLLSNWVMLGVVVIFKDDVIFLGNGHK